MDLTIQLGFANTPDSSIRVHSPSADPRIDEILFQVKQNLNPWHLAVLERGINGLEKGVELVAGGVNSLPRRSQLFLALPQPEGPEKLEGSKRASEYELKDGCTLLLMCSSILPDE